MTERPVYKTTLFDRFGPDAGIWLKGAAYGIAAGGITWSAILLIAAQGGHVPGSVFFFAFVAALVVGAAASAIPIWIVEKTGDAIHEVAFSGSSTPYVEQYSFQQSLVMRGRLDEALSSYEAIIAEEDSTVDVRIRCAELYAREAKNHVRAEQLFREVIRHPKCTPGEEVYSANRLADLYTGPLEQPGRALVELRRIADRYKGTKVSERAVAAIRSLKALALEREQDAARRAETDG